MTVNPEERNAWTMIVGVAVGAGIALVVGPPLVGGVAIGLCLGLLFSPKSGRETRQGIGTWIKSIGSWRKQIAEVPLPKPSPNGEREAHKVS